MEGLATVKGFFVKPERYKEEIVLTIFPISSSCHSGGIWRSGFCSACFSRMHDVALALEWGPVCLCSPPAELQQRMSSLALISDVFLLHTSLPYY